jgi:hypothetical protein
MPSSLAELNKRAMNYCFWKGNISSLVKVGRKLAQSSVLFSEVGLERIHGGNRVPISVAAETNR